MNRYLKTGILLLFVSVLVTCEKDDICADGTPTTPRLIIEFYNAVNPSVLKPVTNLRITAVGAEESLAPPFNGVSTIKLPLRTFEDFTQYTFTLNSGATDGSANTDTIQINYTRNDIYVSRACGFKTHFELSSTEGFQILDTNDTAVWIQTPTILKTKIETEDDVHIKLFF